MFSNDSDARDLLLEASAESDDALWLMPIDTLHDRELGHNKADLKNIGVHGGSACSAAAFLRNFVDYAWVHVDIAGKAHTEFARSYYGQGATGFGCRLLIRAAALFAEQYAPIEEADGSHG
jgi:leucyl aminopeptidase